jgi:hypothetical protein
LLGEHVRSEGIQVSDRTVGRILKDADLQPHRQQMYLTSHDHEFREKRDDVLRLYYEAPKTQVLGVVTIASSALTLTLTSTPVAT